MSENQETHEYRVVWGIYLPAKSPQEAAIVAREMQLDPESQTTDFMVYRKDQGEPVVWVDTSTHMSPKSPPQYRVTAVFNHRDEADETKNLTHTATTYHPEWDEAEVEQLKAHERAKDLTRLGVPTNVVVTIHGRDPQRTMWYVVGASSEGPKAS